MPSPPTFLFLPFMVLIVFMILIFIQKFIFLTFQFLSLKEKGSLSLKKKGRKLENAEGERKSLF